MNSAEKVYKKAEENDLMGDEENAYMFYMRFFNIMQEVAKTTKYQNDKVAKRNTTNSLQLQFTAKPFITTGFHIPSLNCQMTIILFQSP